MYRVLGPIDCTEKFLYLCVELFRPLQRREMTHIAENAVRYAGDAVCKISRTSSVILAALESTQ